MMLNWKFKGEISPKCSLTIPISPIVPLSNCTLPSLDFETVIRFREKF